MVKKKLAKWERMSRANPTEDGWEEVLLGVVADRFVRALKRREDFPCDGVVMAAVRDLKELFMKYASDYQTELDSEVAEHHGGWA